MSPTPSVVLPSKNSDLSRTWFRLGLVGIFVVSLVLRFWGLSRFNTLVFDEVYYARFASHFLKHELIFTGHPPLSTYIVAIGIWIGERLPWNEGDKNALAGLFLSPFAYRWLNAFTGSFMPLLVAAIAYQLNRRRSFALITGLLIALDGLFLVESRYALNNVYLITLGLLGQLWLLLALPQKAGQRWLWLSLAGIGFGAAAAIKWNGLGFLFGAYLLWGVAWILRGIAFLKQKRSPTDSQLTPQFSLPLPLQNVAQLHLGHILVCFALIPALTYYICWLPYLSLDPSTSFWEVQRQTLEYHERVGGIHAHPYCSFWYTWPLMLRPIAYFYQTAHQVGLAAPVIGPPTPNTAGKVIYDVHAMGNPFLWWFSTAAIVLVIGLLANRLWQWLVSSRNSTPASSLTLYDWISLYLVLNWIANLLPWVKVTRCVFLYHYMEALVFAVLALALVLDRWLFSPIQQRRTMALSVMLIILAAFIFWLPLYLGLPLSPAEIQLRRWLPSWI